MTKPLHGKEGWIAALEDLRMEFIDKHGREPTPKEESALADRASDRQTENLAHYIDMLRDMRKYGEI